MCPCKAIPLKPTSSPPRIPHQDQTQGAYNGDNASPLTTGHNQQLLYSGLTHYSQLTAGIMGFDGLDTTWGAWDLTLSDIAAVQGAQSALGLLGLITPLWLSVFR